MKQFLLLASLILFITGCKSNIEDPGEVNAEELIPFNASQIDAHNSRNSLDWEGSYTGVLPCEDCVGIDTFITIDGEHTYKITQRYIDKNDVFSDDIIHEGTFFWNEEGSSITFENIEGEISTFRVNELFLTPLNKNGIELRPEPGNNFKLLKQ